MKNTCIEVSISEGVLMKDAIGKGLIITFADAAAELQLFIVVVTEYVPASAKEAFGMMGFCKEEVNPLGPFQT